MLTHAEIPQLLKRNHIMKAFYFLPELISPTPRLPVLVLYMGVEALLIGSSLAHLLHSRSPHDHIFWFLVDFSGIAIFGCSIGLQRYSCGSDMSLIGHMTYLPSLMLIVLVLQFLSSCYLFVSQPDWRWRLEFRMATCLLLAIWVHVPLTDRYLVEFSLNSIILFFCNDFENLQSENSSADISLVLHTNAFNWLLVSGIFMGARVPERFAPGTFDIFGYGHQVGSIEPST
ncbi:unnamed protein product [Nippostrongylus brasiliensis]|uniref:Uncharacterized protein n=1 Tax=Nippostrongylus brasiliensis TaxID=27835 RepID=A0A0N4YF09_NIPBR|nr:unnamed protein product [Nippostrongylus brasiliensis]